MMKQEDLINAVNRIHASDQLKAKAISGEPASRRKTSVYTTMFKGAACLAALAIIALGAVTLPKILKPVSSVVPAAQSNSSEDMPALYHDNEIQNILILGIDGQDNNDSGRSDSMLMVSIDKRHSKLKVTSFLRDMYVKFPAQNNMKYQDNRLNTAYAYGGPSFQVKTIESNFRVDIDNYITIDYSAFEKIIDKIGGVTISITEPEAKLINQYSGESADKQIAAGTVTLTGKQALYYSRIRHIDSDFARTERQRKVVASIVNKLKASNAGTIMSILNDVFPQVTTDMNQQALLGLAQNSITCMNYPVSQSRVPADSTYKEEVVREMSVLVPDVEANKQILTKFIYEDVSTSK